jgi:hypothetical protein
MPDRIESMQTRMERIRERRMRHEEEMLSVHWFTPAILAARWGISETTVREIPPEQLPYKEFGTGEKLKRRRYHPDDVAAYEARKVGSAVGSAA